MKFLSRAVLLLALLAQAAAAPQGPGDLRRARGYLREVKQHLLQSYIDRDRMKEIDLVAAGLGALDRALDDLPLEPADRRAARGALAAEETLDGALSALSTACPEADLVALADAAAGAMVRATGDPFSRILTDQDLARLMKMMQGGRREPTAGVVLQLRDGRASVAYVQYGTPAYEEGIEIGDEVLSLRGREARELRSEELGDLLALPPGRTLELTIRRAGRDYPFRLQGRPSAVGDVRAEYLGQGVGYLRLTIFDLALVGEARAALRKLSRQGMRGLILDLRHNPGGALPASTGVADLFLPQGLLITRTVSHYKPSIAGIPLPGLGGNKDYKTTAASDFEEIPMICLVNRASASASELLAGALKGHRRALLVGETTYGKGVGQTPIVLTSMGMKRFLYLTVLRYTTPDGGEVDRHGVEPDVAFSDARPSPETFDALWRLRQDGALERYRDARWDDRLRALGGADGFDPARYDGFEALYAGLATGLTRDQVREELRRSVRRRMADEGTSWISDLQSDRVLQKGLVELLDRMN